MGDYTNRTKQGYDVEQVLIDAAAIAASIAAKGAGSNVVHVGENVDLDVTLQVRGAVTGTSPTLDVAVVECDTVDGTFTAVPGGAFTQITATGEETIQVRTTKAFVNATATIGGTATPTFNDTEVFIAS